MNIPLKDWNGSGAVTEALERIQKENARSARLTLALAIVGTIAAIIAAVPVVQSWVYGDPALMGSLPVLPDQSPRPGGESRQ
jgi:hypothetical protein